MIIFRILAIFAFAGVVILQPCVRAQTQVSANFPASSPVGPLTFGPLTVSGGYAEPGRFTTGAYETSSTCSSCSQTITVTLTIPASNPCIGLDGAWDSSDFNLYGAGQGRFYIVDDQGDSWTEPSGNYARGLDACLPNFKNFRRLTITELTYTNGSPDWEYNLYAFSATVSAGNPTVDTPTFSPAGGTYSTPQMVVLSDATPGATIYYTTDGSTPSISSTNYANTIAVSKSEIISAIAVASGYSSSSVSSASFTINSPTPSPPILLDPTPLALLDRTQSLMDGNHVTSDPTKLDTLGRPVQGIAADGTAEIVLRIPINAANDNVTATILSDSCIDTADPTTCAVSTAADLDGGLLALVDAANPTKAAPTAAVTAADSNKFAYVIYRAPIDFVRLGNPVDQLLDTRSIQFMLTYKTAQGTIYGTQYSSLTIVRPPIVLTHGYASSAVETWGSFNLPVAHTSLYEVDYSAFVRVAQTTPGILCEFDCVTVVRQSDLGIVYNTPGVAEQSVSKLRDYALGNNVIKGPVAVSQLDSIAHSMGGLIERYWSTDKAEDPLSGKSVPFRTPDNFGAGYIHKLITLGTPNYGTPFATESIAPGGSNSSPPGSACFRDVSAVEVQDFGKPARYIVGSAILGDVSGTVVGGAVGELDGDGVGNRLSAPIQEIKDQAAHVSTFNIAGNTSPGFFGAYDGINAVCGIVSTGRSVDGDPVASRMTQQLYGTLFDPALTPATEQFVGIATPNDGVVPVTSALLGRSCNVTGTQCFDAAHGEGTQKLLGASQNLLDDKDVQSFVSNLLNTSVQDVTKWVVQ